MKTDIRGVPVTGADTLALLRYETALNQFQSYTGDSIATIDEAFTWIYSRGIEATPWLPQGVRFGVAVALLTIVPTYLIYYVVQPMPGVHVAKQIGFDGVLVVLLGIAVAFLYREHAAVRQA